ncbi:biotin--[acetyl-CoA-carboxylase] ligase [Tsuneonella sp. HG222]
MIEYVPETGSTNADLIARLAAGERIPEGFWLVADHQRSGRGRQGRNWIDSEGNFAGSTVVHLSDRDLAPSGLSFVAALAVYETVLAMIAVPQELQLKWPNDVLLGGAKFCGLLLEREGDAAVIGIGVNLAGSPDVADRRTRSLAFYGPAPDRDAFARALVGQFDLELGRWRQFGLEPVLNRWKLAAHAEGTPLRVHDGAGEVLCGTYAGLAPDGALQLRLDNGDTRVIHAGDVAIGEG